jgi:hypothetical protein
MHAHNEVGSLGETPLPAALVKSSTSHRRFRRFTKRNFALAISVLAVIISLLTYNDQHDVARATVVADEETYAAKVGFWLVSPDKPGQLPNVDIDNAGVLPVSNVRFLLTATGHPWVNAPGTEWYWVTIAAYPIPPCTIVTTHIEQIAMSHIKPLKGIKYKLSIQSLDFTDASGLTWARSVNGALTQASGYQSGNWETLSTPVPTKLDTANAPGCS